MMRICLEDGGWGDSYRALIGDLHSRRRLTLDRRLGDFPVLPGWSIDVSLRSSEGRMGKYAMQTTGVVQLCSDSIMDL